MYIICDNVLSNSSKGSKLFFERKNMVITPINAEALVEKYLATQNGFIQAVMVELQMETIGGWPRGEVIKISIPSTMDDHSIQRIIKAHDGSGWKVEIFVPSVGAGLGVGGGFVDRTLNFTID